MVNPEETLLFGNWRPAVIRLKFPAVGKVLVSFPLFLVTVSPCFTSFFASFDVFGGGKCDIARFTTLCEGTVPKIAKHYLFPITVSWSKMFVLGAHVC